MSESTSCNQATSDHPAPEARGVRSRLRRAPVSQADPRAVAVALAAMAIAVTLAVALAYRSKGPASAPAPVPAPAPRAATPPHQPPAGASSTPALDRQGPPVVGQLIADLSRAASPAAAAVRRPRAQLPRYRASGYSLAYPHGWLVSRRDQPVSDYRETVLASADGAAKVTVDYSPGETIDPAAKASQVEAATSRTPGYQRIAFTPVTIEGRAAFAWDFKVADADARRADLFVKARSGGFALLAHGLDFARARSVARAIAGSLSDAG